MNVHPYTVFNYLLHYTHDSILYITDSFSFETETVHFQMEETRQENQDATSNSLLKVTTPNTNHLDTNDEKINYIKAFLKAHHSHPVPLTTPTNYIFVCIIDKI